MTKLPRITITLPSEDLEKALKKAAIDAGVTPSELMLESIQCLAAPHMPPAKPARRVAGNGTQIRKGGSI